MRTPMNYLLVNLAVADITVAIFIAPRYILSRLYTHPTGVTGTYVPSHNMSIPQGVQHGIASVFAVMILINFVGNSLVIRIVQTNQYMKTPMNYLLLNLAVADMTVAVFLAPRKKVLVKSGIDNILFCSETTFHEFKESSVIPDLKEQVQSN
ncbi:Alpha-1B adrenergic receptor [Exaiptasia diaphana]|nr:Alpha-1B adrenergic receptor [Exaiptasia diaphana]